MSSWAGLWSQYIRCMMLRDGRWEKGDTHHLWRQKARMKGDGVGAIVSELTLQKGGWVAWKWSMLRQPRYDAPEMLHYVTGSWLLGSSGNNVTWVGQAREQALYILSNRFISRNSIWNQHWNLRAVFKVLASEFAMKISIFQIRADDNPESPQDIK